MERKIGEIFEYNGEWYQCIIGHCNQCSFDEAGTCKFIGNPYCAYRNDKKLACFKKLEKVGEPYEHCGKLYQCYKLPMEIEIRLLPNNCNPIGKDNLVEIEIKQIKGDMEDNKLNLKPFDIQKAREGKSVCTRDGRRVRILCFDAKRKDKRSIIALVPSKDYPGFEDLIAYPDNGNYYGGHENDGDLMMFPERREGWVNVYKGSVCISVYPRIYKSRDEAVSDNTTVNRIDTVKIYWEE